MQNLGIIGFGWLGSRIAKRLSNRYKIFATTTTPAKAQDLNAKGYHPTLVSFPDTLDPEIKTLCWPDEIDFDPDVLYYKATGEPLPEWMKS